MKHRESVGIRERSFDKNDQPTTFVQYPSQQAAFRFLDNILIDERGVGLLHGPKSSGKSTLIRQFVDKLESIIAVAVIDGTRLKAPQLLSGIIEQYGYSVELSSTDELLNMLRVIVAQQTRSHRAPVLIVENFNNMFPSALCVLCKLASQKVHLKFALRIILVSDRYFHRIIDSPSMRPIADRLTGDFELKPLPEQEVPKLIVTHNGDTQQEFEFVNSRALIGRSDFSDMLINGEFVSRQHALLIRDENAVIIFDLKSRNGTFVNSRRVSSKVLRDSDIIMIGDHRIKLIYPSCDESLNIDDLEIDDTATMKSITGARRAKTGKNLHISAAEMRKA